MKITRYFTREGQSPYADIPFRSARASGAAAELSGSETALQVPAAYSQAAIDMLAHIACGKKTMPAKLKKIPEDDVPEWLWRAEADDSALAELSPNDRFSAETDARQIFNRLSGAWTYTGWKNGYFNSEKDARAFYDEICYMLAGQYAAPNAAQWQNTGLYHAYGTKAPAADFWQLNPQTNEAERPRCGDWSLPFASILRDADKSGTAALLQDYARNAQFGAATGSNISALSSEAELDSLFKAGNAAPIFGQNSRGFNTGSVAVAVLNADHADIEAYISAGGKAEAENAALAAGQKLLAKHAEAIIAACRAAGTTAQGAVGTAIPFAALKNNSAETKMAEREQTANPVLKAAVAAALQDGVEGRYIQQLIRASEQGGEQILLRHIKQAAALNKNVAERRRTAHNILRRAVALPRSFMRAVERDEDWAPAPHRVNAAPAELPKTLKARQLWDKIAYAAWASSAPELQFHATVNEWHTTPAAGEINASSADSAFLFAGETACAAFTLNLNHFSAEKNRFDSNAFIYAVRLWVIAADIAPLTALRSSAEAVRQSRDYRPAALGYANLAALLSATGIAYDSDESRALCAALTALMTGAAYVASAELAAELGAFNGYAGNAQAMLRTVRNHRRAAYGQMHGYEKLGISPAPLKAAQCPNAELAALARAAWDKALRMGEIYGFRNAGLTALSAAPAACTLLDCDTKGLAPEKSLIKFKKRPDGSRFKIISRAVPQALNSLGYTSEQIADISTYLVGAADLEHAPEINSAALRAKGFNDKALKQLEAALPNASCLRAVFTSAILGEEFCHNILGFAAEEMAEREFNMLKALGFAAEQIARAESFLCGAASAAGAPHLAPEHYAVFACGGSSSGGISWSSQIRMMAAAQAFLCGGISHNLVLPAEATAEDCAKAAMTAWKSGLKSINLSRAREELPLRLRLAMQAFAETETETASPQMEETAALHSPGNVETEQKETAEPARQADILPQIMREKLPNRRQGYTQTAIISGHKVYLHTSEFKDGRLGEIFIDMQQEGAAFRAVIQNFAAAVSLGLQYGVPLEAFVEAFAFSKFEPAGLVRGNERIKNAGSVLDYVFRELAVSYLNRQDLAHIQIDDSSATALAPKTEDTEMRLIPAGWQHSLGFKSNIAAPPPAAAAEKSPEKPAAADATAEKRQNDNETADESSIYAPMELIFSQFAKSASDSPYAAGAELSAPAGNTAPVQERVVPEASQTAAENKQSAGVSAPIPAYKTSAPPIPSYSPLRFPFSNPDYFSGSAKPAEAVSTEREEISPHLRQKGDIGESFKIIAPHSGAEKFEAGKTAKPREESLEAVLERSLIHELFGRPTEKDDAAPRADAKLKQTKAANLQTPLKAQPVAAKPANTERTETMRSSLHSIFIGAEPERAIRLERETMPTERKQPSDKTKTARPEIMNSPTLQERAEMQAHIRQDTLNTQIGEEETAPQTENRAAAKNNEKSPYRAQPVSLSRQGYTGDICPECGNSAMLRNGTVLKCDICGAVSEFERNKNA